ncbi:thioredoxin-related transmembrane protein 2 homolog [Coccinella septempunctata]|uniref:thioredoxin-related transmembrane protein 2 homolog n=1 Tax=Coccinella septempunctata TaxID=41139 RepID=UPI001D065EE1|nr:thioredoxin-related transmembrane protein 2 homolog [Coccinella septempunctata]
MTIKQDLRQLLKPYYLFNILLSLSYIAFKRLPILCNYFFQTDQCEFDGKETEILFFLMIVVMIRTRKAGSVSMINYLSSSFIYTKVANLILWFNADFLMGIFFGIIFIFGAFLFPEPTYSGADLVVYFRGADNLEEEIQKDKQVTWLITFYAVWNPACVNFAPVFSKLSNLYGLETLKFGKIDVGRHPEAARKYQVNDSSFSKQLPTVILFKEGKEVMRRPIPDGKKSFVKFPFHEESIKNVFGLNCLYDEAKNLLNSKKRLKAE